MNTQEFKRKLTAVFSADVAGYSRLMGEDEAATVKTLESYKQIMFSLIKQHRGRVIDSPGDNLLAEFASVVDAVQCGVAVQKELQARNAELPENRKMHFRIGINLGDVIEEQDRIYGDGVNIAARLESCADPGGICVSKTAFDHIETKLPLGYEYLGEKEVKNIAKPVGAYRVLMDPRVTVAGAKEKKPLIPLWKKKGALVGAIAVLVVIIGVAVWNFYGRAPRIEPASKEKMAFPLPDKPSIAVLPFKNLSGEAGQEFLADGITESIIGAISRVSGLFVIASNSVFTYKGKPVKVQQVSEELGVRNILEGTVQRVGNQLRVNAQLIDATTGQHLWSEKYDRDIKDIFSVQDQISKEILTALRVKLGSGEQERVWARGTGNLEAYLKYLQAYDIFRTFNKKNMILTRQVCEEAIALDPNYEAPYVLLGGTHIVDLWFNWAESPRSSAEKAVAALQKALSLYPQSDSALANLGCLYVVQERFDEAVEIGEKAVALNPNGDLNMHLLGLTYNSVRRYEEALTLIKEAIRRNPYCLAIYITNLCWSYSMLGRWEEAIAEYKRLLNRHPDHFPALTGMAIAYGMAGRLEEGRAVAAQILKMNPGYCIEKRKTPYKYKSDLESEREALRKVGIPEKAPLPLPDKPSIAVLPFVNMSEDKSQEFFSYGLTEEIITALSKTPKLFVIARNSSFVYKGKPVNVQQVSRDLGVKYVLEGSVRRSGDQLRITAQLIDATTGNHLWAERYDREIKDVFIIQDDVTMKILTSLQVKLTAGEEARMWARGTKNLNAYLKVLTASEHMVQFNKEANVVATRLAKEAVELDPQYASAYLVLAKTQMMDVLLGTSSSPKQSMGQAIHLAQKAIAIDESLGAARGLLGFLYTMTGQFDKGIEEAEKSIDLEPNSDLALQYLGLALRWGGRPSEAIPVMKKAIRLNPFAPSNYLFNLGLSYLFVGQYEEAISECRKATTGEPNNLGAQLALTVAYSLSGRDEDARATAAEVLRIDPKFSLEGFSKSVMYKNQADKERFVAALAKSGLK